MLAKRIIPCLDVCNGKVVKGFQFKNHDVVGDIVPMAKKYSDAGADELVLYDISASVEQRNVDYSWVEKIARNINIPFCVAGGIRSLNAAKAILESGCDKVSINTPAQEDPHLINEFSHAFGSQAVVVGIDSRFEDGDFFTYLYTGSEKSIIKSKRRTKDWAREVQDRGAGEIVLNCMSRDGAKNGYDIDHINEVCQGISIPIVASGGAGKIEHFLQVFQQTEVTGALAASVFHKEILTFGDIKGHLDNNGIKVRI